MRAYASREADKALFSPRALGMARPDSAGLAYETLTFASGDRRLMGWFVPAIDTAAAFTGVLIFHGNGTSIAEQVGLLKALSDARITSMVFDYSGYGASTGKPSVAALREDALAALGEFNARMGPNSRRFVLGTSLGAAVILDAMGEMQNSIDGVIVVGTFASSVQTAVRRGRVPGWLAFLLDDPYDNVKAAAALEKPLLVIHSAGDELFPLSDAEAIFAAASGPKQFVRADSIAHTEYLASPDEWQPVIEFIRNGPTSG